MVAKVTQRQLQAVAILMHEGASSSGAIAVIGNFSWECGSPNLPTAFRTSRLDHGSQGLAQWRLTRLTKYMNMVAAMHPELDQSDFTEDGELWPWFGRLDYQLKFTVQELKESYANLWIKLRRGGDIEVLTADVCWQYERPNKSMAHLAQRTDYSRAIASAVRASPIPVDLPTHLAADAREKAQAQTGAAAMVAAPALALAGTGMASFNPPWWAWVMVAACGLIMCLGLAAYIAAKKQVVALRTAAAGVDASAPEGKVPEPQTTSADPVKNDPAAKVVDKHKANAEKAAADEKAQLDAAMTLPK